MKRTGHGVRPAAPLKRQVTTYAELHAARATCTNKTSVRTLARRDKYCDDLSNHMITLGGSQSLQPPGGCRGTTWTSVSCPSRTRRSRLAHGPQYVGLCRSCVPSGGRHHDRACYDNRKRVPQRSESRCECRKTRGIFVPPVTVFRHARSKGQLGEAIGQKREQNSASCR